MKILSKKQPPNIPEATDMGSEDEQRVEMGSFLTPPPPKFSKKNLLKNFRLAYLKVQPSFITGS